MTSDTNYKQPIDAGLFKNNCILMLFASVWRRLHRNRVSCIGLSIFVLFCLASMLPFVLRLDENNITAPQDTTDNFSSSPRELLRRLKLLVASQFDSNKGTIKIDDSSNDLGRISDNPYGSKLPEVAKQRNDFESEIFKTKKVQVNIIADPSEDYGEFSKKINQLGKKMIRKHYSVKIENGTRIWGDKINKMDSDKENISFDDQKPGHLRYNRKRKLKNERYIENVSFKYSKNWTDKDTDQEEQILAQRVGHLQDACKNLHSQEKQHYTELPLDKVMSRTLWVQSKDIVWCPIFKSASTTWVENLVQLANNTKKRGNSHALARKLYPRPSDPKLIKGILEKSMKLLIVRHPLDRLLSAYRDKMLRELPGSREDPYRDLQRVIYRNFPNPTLPSDITPLLPDLPEQPTFNQFLLKVKEDLQVYWNRNGKSQINLHWRPYWATCSPCSFGYTTIAKVETLQRDQEYIIRDRALNGTALNARAHSSKFDSFNSTSEATKAYFSRVPRSLLEAVAQLYGPDFQLFDYSSENYLKLAIQEL